MNIAVIGSGYWGKNLVRVFHEIGALKGVCDINKDILADLKVKYKGIRTTDSLSDVLSDSSIKAVAIATPACKHYEMAREALLSDKDVFVEKPLSLKVEEGEDLVKLAKEKNRILMVGHILQYHPAINKLKELISSGYLGKIQYIYSNRLNIGKLRTEENILWSFAPHDISVILSLIGKEPKNVCAFGEAYLQEGIYDVTLTILDFPSQIKAHIFVSWLHPFKEQRLIVVGNKRMAVFDDTNPTEKLIIYPHTIEWKEGRIPIAQKAEKEIIQIQNGEPLKLECQHFLECVEKRKEPKTNGEEGLRVLKILNMAEDSLKNKTSINYTQKKKYFVHPTSIIDEGVEIGEGTKIWHFSHILRGSKIGKNCAIGQNVMIGPDIKIGDRCKIQNNVSVYKGVTLEDEVFCGPSCVFTNVITPRAFIERKHEFKPTLVKKGSTIGANATIVCGVTIGRYALIGAGAVVTEDVPDYALYLGVPARQRGWVCKCGVVLTHKVKNKNKERLICSNCRSRYILDGEKFLILEEKI